MKNILFLIALFISVSTQNTLANNGKPTETTIEMVCTTATSLSGLEILTPQVLEGVDSQGNTVYVNCTVVQFETSPNLKITVTTTDDISGIVFLTDQIFDFIKVSTGTLQSVGIIVEDVIVH